MELDSLILTACQGDDEAFYELICLYKAQLYKIAFSYLKNEQDSLEAVQETTFRAYKNFKKLKEPKYFQTWLIRILINYCQDELKRRKKIEPISPYVPIGTEKEINSDKVGVQIAIEQLEQKYRQVILLKYFEDLTIKDIANIMERPEGTIKTWLNQALTRLRSKLGGEKYV